MRQCGINPEKFFKFTADLISNKYSPQFSIKQKSVGGCLYFCNQHCSNLRCLNTVNDLSFQGSQHHFKILPDFQRFSDRVKIL